MIDADEALIDSCKSLTDRRKIAIQILPKFNEPSVDLLVSALKARQAYFHLLSAHRHSITPYAQLRTHACALQPAVLRKSRYVTPVIVDYQGAVAYALF